MSRGVALAGMLPCMRLRVWWTVADPVRRLAALWLHAEFDSLLRRRA